MKKLIVFFCFICIALGEWHQSKEFTLPKGLQVNDLAISNTGELWILSSSSILKYETAADAPFYIRNFENGKVLAVYDNTVYIIDQANRLYSLDLAKEEMKRALNTSLNITNQIVVVPVEEKPFLVIREANRLSFILNDNRIGSINTVAEKISMIPTGDYGNSQTPFYTLSNNRISAWTGGTFTNPDAYTENPLYSTSSGILDFTADRNGNLYILFSDSIVVLQPNGKYRKKISIDNVPMNSKILTDPTNNNVVIFNRRLNSLKILTGIQKNDSREIIVLNNNQPNPVDNYTEIEFSINQPLNLTLTIYNLIGEPVKVIASGRYSKGTHRAVWRADDENGNLVPNGIYFYRLESNKGVAIRQLIVLR